MQPHDERYSPAISGNLPSQNSQAPIIQTQQFTGVAPAGHTYVMPDVTPLSHPPDDLQLIRVSKPWKIYGRMLGTVIVATFIAQLIFMVPFGLAIGDPTMSICGGVCAAPFVFLLTFMRRPKLVHLQRAVQDDMGSNVHRLPMGGSLQTPTKTRFSHHIVRDDSLLDTPPSRNAWILFAGLLVITTSLTILYFTSEAGEIVAILLFIIIGIPAWLLGFSIPVIAWWSWCTRRLGLHTRQREAESWLVAGMLSAIPALTINSMIFPIIAGAFFSDAIVEMLLPVVSAPFGEEICKGLFVLAFVRSIDSPKRGFQIGFTVGLGFAMLENLIYILSSTFGGPIAFTFTALIRGIGSIPGHAFWTGLTGAGLGWYMMEKNGNTNKYIQTPEKMIEPTTESPLEWKLLDPKSGEFVGETQDDEAIIAPATELLGEFRLPLLEPFTEVEKKGGLPVPKHPLIGLCLAISGHAFWNGSLTALELIGTALNLSDTQIFATSLIWSVFLVSGILLLGRGIVYGVISAPTPEN
ncbi:MAG: PrsW family intramembrane metalloprotease [Euryarchaeota archaeon]|nr:PrsW family intramembrane metalloprotease [Euryarchaeota archaeon]